MWEHMFVKTHASILKGPRRARSQTYTYFWIILARLGRHKSNMKSMHARMLWARMQDTLNDALPPWECKVKLIHVTEDMCMSVFYKWSLLIGNALDNMTARTCTLFYWAVCDERRPGAILDRYRNGAAGDSKGRETPKSHAWIIQLMPPLEPEPLIGEIPASCIHTHSAGDCCQHRIFYTTSTRQWAESVVNNTILWPVLVRVLVAL